MNTVRALVVNCGEPPFCTNWRRKRNRPPRIFSYFWHSGNVDFPLVGPQPHANAISVPCGVQLFLWNRKVSHHWALNNRHCLDNWGLRHFDSFDSPIRQPLTILPPVAALAVGLPARRAIAQRFSALALFGPDRSG